MLSITLTMLWKVSMFPVFERSSPRRTRKVFEKAAKDLVVDRAKVVLPPFFNPSLRHVASLLGLLLMIVLFLFADPWLISTVSAVPCPSRQYYNWQHKYFHFVISSHQSVTGQHIGKRKERKDGQTCSVATTIGVWSYISHAELIVLSYTTIAIRESQSYDGAWHVDSLIYMYVHTSTNNSGSNAQDTLQ